MDWSISLGTVFNWQDGLEWAVPENAKINGVVVPMLVLACSLIYSGQEIH